MSLDILDSGIQLSPEVCQALFKSRREPLVVKGQLKSWRESGLWVPTEICKHLGSKTTTFKISSKMGTHAFREHFKEKEAIYETQCDYVVTTFSNFFQWLNSSQHFGGRDIESKRHDPSLCKRIKVDCDPQLQDIESAESSFPFGTSSSLSDQSSSRANPLLDYPKSEYWIYADYKYMAQLCRYLPDLLYSVDWSVVGLKARDGKDSTLWIGSEGANTPCHFDTYGCNFVAQLHGKKKWTLFSPQDSEKLYPTRIPYEESSVFCRVNVSDPDMTKYPLFSEATAYEVILEPGDLLYVPRHWWHYVESVGEEPTVSINTWVDQPEDAYERVKEAVVRAIVSVFADQAEDETSCWVNPNEVLFSSEENMLLLSKVLKEHKAAQQDQQSISESTSDLLTADFLQILTSSSVVNAVTEALTKHK